MSDPNPYFFRLDSASTAPGKITGKPPLSFDIQPQLLQHLGSNLYTKLNGVLIEFLANAHDADAINANVQVNFEAINKAREIVKNQYKLEQSQHESDKDTFPAPRRWKPASSTKTTSSEFRTTELA